MADSVSSAVAVTNYRLSVLASGGEWMHLPLAMMSGTAITDDGYILITSRDYREIKLKLSPGHDSW